MRVEIAMPSSFMTRRSMVRAIRLVTIRKPAMTTMPLSSAQRLNFVLPGTRSMLSSVRSTPLNQPSTWKEMAAQNTKVMRSSQARIQLFGPSETRKHVHAEPHQHQHRGQVHRDVDERRCAGWKLANSARRPRNSTTAMNEGASTMPAIDQPARPARQVGARGHRAQPALDVVRRARWPAAPP